MLPKHAVIFDTNDVVGVFWIIVLQVQQNFELNTSLMLELLFVSDDLDCNDLASLVIDALQSLSKRSFPQIINDFEPVCDLIF